MPCPLKMLFKVAKEGVNSVEIFCAKRKSWKKKKASSPYKKCMHAYTYGVKPLKIQIYFTYVMTLNNNNNNNIKVKKGEESSFTYR